MPGILIAARLRDIGTNELCINYAEKGLTESRKASLYLDRDLSASHCEVRVRFPEDRRIRNNVTEARGSFDWSDFPNGCFLAEPIWFTVSCERLPEHGTQVFDAFYAARCGARNGIRDAGLLQILCSLPLYSFLGIIYSPFLGTVMFRRFERKPAESMRYGNARQLAIDL